MRKIVLCLVALFASAGQCGNPIYSEKCRDLADELGAAIQTISDGYRACGAAADCTYAAVVIPCDRDSVVNTVVNAAQVDAFRQEIAALSSSRCTASSIDDCNAQCGTTGELVFQITAATCTANRCESTSIAGDSDASLPSSEICAPSKFVYLPEDLGDGVL